MKVIGNWKTALQDEYKRVSQMMKPGKFSFLKTDKIKNRLKDLSDIFHSSVD